jgi:hypothetical protein
MTRDPAAVIRAARSQLQTAEHGLADAGDPNPRRRTSGLHNAIVFGRAVTNVIENLRHSVDNFDAWYKPRSAALAADPESRKLYEMRSQILKQGTDLMEAGVAFENFGPEQLAQIPRPPGAVAFFIGDEHGGSGWVVPGQDGGTNVYYVELPASVGLTVQRTIDIGHETVDVVPVLRRYLQAMRELIDEAEAKFVTG